MIARVWSAHTTLPVVRAYADHLRARVLPEVRRIDGYAGAMPLEREASGKIELMVITWWRSLGAIRRFARADFEAAVVADEAASLMTAYDRRVPHTGWLSRTRIPSWRGDRRVNESRTGVLRAGPRR